MTNEQLIEALDIHATSSPGVICGILGGLLTIGFATIGLLIALS